MRYGILASRILLGLIFIIPGINKLLHLLPIAVTPGDAATYLNLLFSHHILNVVAVLEIAGALLLLWGRYVPLGLALLAPIAVNIFMYHLFLDPPRLVIAVALIALEAFLIWAYRSTFATLLEPNVLAVSTPE